MTVKEQEDMIIKLRDKFNLTLYKAKSLLEQENYNYNAAAKLAKANVNETTNPGKQLLHD